jgi:hypothetical protein
MDRTDEEQPNGAGAISEEVTGVAPSPFFISSTDFRKLVESLVILFSSRLASETHILAVFLLDREVVEQYRFCRYAAEAKLAYFTAKDGAQDLGPRGEKPSRKTKRTSSESRVGGETEPRAGLEDALSYLRSNLMLPLSCGLIGFCLGQRLLCC